MENSGRNKTHKSQTLLFFKVIPIPLLFSSIFFSATAFTHEEIRNYFEWGEYAKLVGILEPCLDSLSVSPDSVKAATYHNYLGTAYFGLGDIGKAHRNFQRALELYSGVLLDSAYVSEEIMNLFNATRSDLINRKKTEHYQDSLLVAEQVGFKSNLRKIELDALQKRKRNNMILLATFYGISAFFTGCVIYERRSTRTEYNEFRKAASSGDKESYDKFKRIIYQANTLMISGDIAAGSSALLGVFFTFKIGALKKDQDQ